MQDRFEHNGYNVLRLLFKEIQVSGILIFPQLLTLLFSYDSVEAVNVITHDNVQTCPDLKERDQVTSVDYINKAIGIHLKPEEIVNLLRKMSMPARKLTFQSETFQSEIVGNAITKKN